MNFIARTWFNRFLLGICTIIVLGSVLYSPIQREINNYYYNQFQNYIVDDYMGGLTEVGNFSFNRENKQSIIYPTGKFTGDIIQFLQNYKIKKIPPEVTKGRTFPEVAIWDTQAFNKLSNKNNFKKWTWADYLKCLVVRKTDKGFVFIEEYIDGIGFAYDVTKVTEFIKIEPAEGTGNGMYIDEDLQDPNYNYYLEDFGLCENYLRHLKTEKYKNVDFDSKYDKLMNLRTHKRNGQDFSSFSNNDYFELKFEGTPITKETTFGNNYNMLFGKTYTFNYLIKPIGEKLNNTIFATTIIIILSLISIWGIFCIILYKKQYNWIKSYPFSEY